MESHAPAQPKGGGLGGLIPGMSLSDPGLRDRIQVVVYAYETGLITPRGRAGDASSR